MATATPTLNGLKPDGETPYLLCHKLQNVWETGSTRSIKTDDGYETSELTFGLEFGVDAAAWAELTSE